MILFVSRLPVRTGSVLAVHRELARRKGHDLVWMEHFLTDGARRHLFKKAAVVVDDSDGASLDGMPYTAKVVQLHHGTPLKKMGLDTPQPNRRMWVPISERAALTTRYSAASSPEVAWIWKRSFGFRGGTSVLRGTPRADAMVLNQEPAPDRVLLYAPTWREGRRFPKEDEVLAVSRAMPEGWTIRVKLHPKMEDRPVPGVESVSRAESPEAAMMEASALLTDYSSVMFDWLLLDRPLLLWQPDFLEYRARRGVYFDPATLPGVHLRSLGDLAQALEKEDDPADRKRFRDRFCLWEDGQATQRAADAVEALLR